MIRPVTPADTDALVRLTAATGFFKPLELDALREVLDDYHAANETDGHRAFAWDEGGRLLGYVYHAPTPMTDRSWHLYWIAVDPSQQGRGLGGKMLAFAEDDIRGHEGRLLIIETSTTPHYEPTRRFYLKYGYTHAASVPDFYADGDGMAVFTKHLELPSSHPRGL
ncbi:GNAT family N-acetyltransferase [Gemmata sp.]|uniref:GNAT family N-acetyltransferase n=1 Tax=Gemmata sp. TaxID=1914242 RepID=UPI003F6EF7D0